MNNIAEIKDIAETAMYMVTALGAPIAAIWTLLQWREALQQRKVEFRWKQADLGRQLLDQLFDEPVAGVALELIDGELEFIETPEDGKIRIESNQIINALSNQDNESSVDKYIRKAFDYLLYYLERFEVMTRSNLVEIEDISIPTKYYCMKMKPYMKEISTYANKTGYYNALTLINKLQGQD